MWSEAEKKRFRDSDRRFNIGFFGVGAGLFLTTIFAPISIGVSLSHPSEVPHALEWGVGAGVVGICLVIIGYVLAKEAMRTGGRATHPLFQD